MTEVDAEILKQIPNTTPVDWSKPVIWTGNQNFKVNVIADLYSNKDHKVINITGYGKTHYMMIDRFGYPSYPVVNSALQRVVNIPKVVESRNILLIAEYHGSGGYSIPHMYPISRSEADDFKSKHTHYKSFKELII